MTQKVIRDKPSISERIGSGIDKFISIFNPRAAYKRTAYRSASRIMASSYKGASHSRLRQEWIPGGKSPDEDLLPELATLRERSRELNRNDAFASGITGTMVTNTVGTGIQMQSNISAESLGISEEEAQTLKKSAEKIWERWCPWADAAERMDFWEIQGLVDRQILENGEAILQPVMLDDPYRPYYTALDIIESDRLCSPGYRSTEKNIRYGVEVGSLGEPIAYWIKKTHPGDITVARGWASNDYVRVPARNSSGRKNILHLYVVNRPGQTRGVPFFAPVLDYFKDLCDYMEAERVAARISACFALFVESEGDAYDKMIGGTDGTNSGGQREMELEPGMIEFLNKGEKISSFNPSRPNASFEAFVTKMLHSICASLGLPYILVAKDFSKTNYSNCRAALLQAYRYFKIRQQFLCKKLCQPSYELVLEEAWLRGEFPVKDFYGQQHELSRAKWITPGWQWVDPLKEAEASERSISKGLSTLADECASQGKDWEENVEQRARELVKIKELEAKHGITMMDEPAPAKNLSPEDSAGNENQENPDEENQ